MTPPHLLLPVCRVGVKTKVFSQEDLFSLFSPKYMCFEINLIAFDFLFCIVSNSLENKNIISLKKADLFIEDN